MGDRAIASLLPGDLVYSVHDQGIAVVPVERVNRAAVSQHQVIRLELDSGADALPHWIIYPTGGGTGLVGIWKALQELIGLGLLDPGTHRLPRMVAVQGENCAPVVSSFEAGLDEVRPVESSGTIADGLDVPGAIMGHGILSTIRDSHNIMVVNGGEIEEFGPHDELMAQKGFYYALYMSQFKGAAPGGMKAVAMDFVST